VETNLPTPICQGLCLFTGGYVLFNMSFCIFMSIACRKVKNPDLGMATWEWLGPFTWRETEFSLWSGSCGQSRNKSKPIDPRYKKYIGVFPSTKNKKSVKRSSHLVSILVLHAALAFNPPNPSQMARLGFLNPCRGWNLPWLETSLRLSWLHDGIFQHQKSQRKCRVKHRKFNQG
jgi:hypothetical protein